MKNLVGYTDLFIDPVTGDIKNSGVDLSKISFITQRESELLPNAQALINLEDGLMRKGGDGVIETSIKIKEEELPELKGEWVKSIFGGDVWRGTEDGRVERSGALSKVEADLLALNAKFVVANFVMGSSIFKPIWQGATFLDQMKPGLLFNCAPLPHEDGILRRANPNVEYMQPDLKEGRIWMGIEDRGYDPVTKQVKAPWLHAGIEIGEEKLITLDSKGKMAKASLTKDHVWCGDDNGNPIEKHVGEQSSDAKYILQEPDESLPNAQALSELGVTGTSLIKVTNMGVIERAIKDEDYATKETLEEIKEEAQEAAEEAEASAEAAEASATEATGAAGEATAAAAEATTAASAATGSAGAAGLAALGAATSAFFASRSSSNASSSASNAKGYANSAKESAEECKRAEVKLRGDVVGSGKLNEDINIKIKDNPVFHGCEGIALAGGTREERPKSPTIGTLRYITNKVDNEIGLEYYTGRYWATLGEKEFKITQREDREEYKLKAIQEKVKDMDTGQVTTLEDRMEIVEVKKKMNNINRRGLKFAAQLSIDSQCAVKIAGKYYNGEVCDEVEDIKELVIACKDIISTTECIMATLPKEEIVKQEIKVK